MGANPALVSIIIPCWNGECLVAEAIDSALAQTYPDMEVIVVNDGSMDGSIEVIKAYGSRVRWATGLNAGASSARNRGLLLARGEYIQFLDVDDVLVRNKLELQMPVALMNPREIVYCARESYRVQEPTKKWYDSPSPMADSVVFALNKIVSIAAPLYPREALLRSGGFRKELACCQDYDLNLRLAMDGWQFRKIPEVLVTIRRREGSISSNAIGVLDQMLVLWREALQALSEKNDLTPVRRRAIAARFASAGRSYIRHGKYASASACFNEAEKIEVGATDLAYSWPLRVTRRLIGPVATECLTLAKRRVIDRSSRPV